MDEQKPETGQTNPNSTSAVPDMAAQKSQDKANDPSAELPNTETISDPLKQLETELAEAKAETAKMVDTLQRTAADFANYRKRVDKERAETYQLAAVETLKKFLPVLDDFDRAIQNMPSDQSSGVAFDTLKLLHRKMSGLLETTGITVINPVGQSFDPAFHEALGTDHDTGAPSGQVTAVLQKGYVYGEKVLRAAYVRVAG